MSKVALAKHTRESENTKGKASVLASKYVKGNPRTYIILVFLISMYITVTTFYIQPTAALQSMVAGDKGVFIFLCNFLPPVLLLVVLFFCLNNIFWAGAISCGIFNVLSMINRVKIELRTEPFVPQDVLLLKEANNSLAHFKIQLNIPLLGLIVLSVIGLILLGIKYKCTKLSVHTRMGGIILGIVAMLGANYYIYSSKVLYENYFEQSPTGDIQRSFEELGFTYCFLHYLNADIIIKPEGFSKEQMVSWVSEQEKSVKYSHGITQEQVKPHIIMVMNEAFSDITNNEVFNFEPEDNPLKYYNSLMEQPNVIGGHIVVPNFGGGTSNTEFDIQTGMQTNLTSQVVTSSFSILEKNTQTIGRVLEKTGYHTLFMHPGESWFYNRDQVYKYFGMDEIVFNEIFTPKDYKGNMIADEAFLNAIINKFEEETTKEKEPLFAYLTTIQNHMAYTKDKYKEQVAQVPLNKAISPEAMEYLSVYVEGLRDADNMLQGLVNYFQSVKEPVVLVFFGDHLPNLGDNLLTYRELGLNIGGVETAEEIISTHSTPYVIWFNDEADKQMKLTEKKKELDLPRNGKLNAQFLGATVLELVGNEADAYFNFANKVRRAVPVSYKGNYQLVEGVYSEELEGENKQLVDQLAKWQYYKVMLEEVED